MFQHGSVHEVVDQEKESCGCPPTEVKGNDFPLAQSEGLAPAPKPAPALPVQQGGADLGEMKLSVSGADRASTAQPADDKRESQPPAQPAAPAKKKPGLFSVLGRFLRRLFGAE